jgi:hypothetical protein
MTTPATGTHQVTVARLLMLVACILFVVAALIFGGVFTGLTAWSFMAGGFAAVALAWAVP